MEYVEVARATSPRGEVLLRRRHDPDGPPGAPGVLELRVNGVFVMDDLETESETVLARAALEESSHPRRVLVGGLGLGFTAHEVLADPRVEHLTVAELEPALVGWFRDGTVPHGREFLAEGRLRVVIADVAQVIAEAAEASYDLVLLDVDNGPDFLVHEHNAALYATAFLQEARRRLVPDGRLVIWSSTRSAELERTLGGVFGRCRSRPVPVVLQGREEEYWLHTAGA